MDTSGWYCSMSNSSLVQWMGVSKDCGNESNHGFMLIVSPLSGLEGSIGRFVDVVVSQTYKSSASLAYHGASLYAFAFELSVKYCSVVGLDSSADVDVENVRWLGTCRRRELGERLEVLRRPRPPPMIFDPVSTLMPLLLMPTD